MEVNLIVQSLVPVVDYVIDCLYNRACCLILVVDVDYSKFHFLLTVPLAYVVGLIIHTVIWSYLFPRLQSRLPPLGAEKCNGTQALDMLQWT